MLVPVADTRTRGFSMPSVRSRAVSGLLRSAPELMGVGGFAVLALVLFWKQWFWNIQDWDEARHIVSAYEMLRSGDWIVNTYRGLPDYWNLKPPLSFWTIAASMKVFGFSPLAMRLPSILATLGTAAVSYGFVRRYAGRWAATCTVFVIATCAPLLNTHTGRTADPDAVYILALTVAVTSAINAMSDPRWLLLATTAFSAAFLTKSWHAVLVLVFTAGVATALRIKRRLGIRHLLLAACGFLPLLTWAALRYAADGTKFFVTMVQYDLLSRTSTTVESHTGTGTYYIDVLQGSFGLWLAAGAFGIAFYLAGAQNGDRSSAIERRLRRMLILLLVWVVLVFGAFSAVPTKLWWYAAPAYPAAAMLVGVGVASGLQAMRRRNAVRAVLVGLVLVAFVAGATDLRTQISTTADNPQQVALARLGSELHGRSGEVALDSSIGIWSQSLVAVAETSGLTPVDTFAGRAASTAGRFLLVPDGVKPLASQASVDDGGTNRLVAYLDAPGYEIYRVLPSS